MFFTVKKKIFIFAKKFFYSCEKKNYSCEEIFFNKSVHVFIEIFLFARKKFFIEVSQNGPRVL